VDKVVFTLSTQYEFCSKDLQKTERPMFDPSRLPDNGAIDEYTPLKSKVELQKDNLSSLNASSNVLLLFRLADFQRRSQVNFWLALISLLCCGVFIVLIVLNYTLNNASEPPNVSDTTFHRIEFWTTFLYALVDAYALVNSPKTMISIWENPNALKILFFFNVVAALTPAFLITIDLEYFEKISHEIEYLNEFSLSFVSFILLGSLVGQKKDGSPRGSALLVSGSVIVAGTTLLVYNLGYEEYAHYLEFLVNIFTCLITFWFCMDNRFVAEMEIGQILFGYHRDCNLCRAGETEFRLSYGGATNELAASKEAKKIKPCCPASATNIVVLNV
jgi:hypothetical protein